MLLLLLLVSSGLFAQKRVEMGNYEKQSEAENFLDLYYELQSAVYLEDGETKIYLEGGDVKVLFALDDLSRLDLSTADFLSSVELLVIKKKQSPTADFLSRCTALRYVVFAYDGGASGSSTFLKLAKDVGSKKDSERAVPLDELVVLYRGVESASE